MTVLVAVAVGALVAYLAVSWPKLAVVAWLLAVAFVPFWVGVASPVYLPPSSIVGILVLFACFRAGKWRLNRYDLVALLVVSLAMISGLAGIARPGDVTNVVTQWILSYVVGRLLPSAQDCISPTRP